MNKQTNKNLIVVGALALMLSASHASAYVPGVWDPQFQMYNNNGAPMTNVIRSSYDPYVQPQVAVQPIYMHPQMQAQSYTYQAQPQYQAPYQYQAQPAQLASPLTTQYVAPVQRTVDQASTAVSNTTQRVVNRVNSNVIRGDVPAAKTIDTTAQMLPVVNGNMGGNIGYDQGASAFNGVSSFMPNSIIQWFFVILLILAIIILARKIGKHNHDVHVVPAH
jgi:hypothetical protein